MFFGVIVITLFMMLLAEEVFFLKKAERSSEEKKKKISRKYLSLMNEKKALQGETDKLESSLSENFLFYDLARKIAPILEKKQLFDTFSEELKRLGRVEKIEFFNSGSKTELKENHLKFKLRKKGPEILEVVTKSKNIAEYMPYFVKLLDLCMERIELYDKLQELSIHDTLTKLYNRRHFMARYEEEFERAKRFKLNLAFLMIDVDHFKKINDTYGHLVGDAVLREVARIIRENIREIDFSARFGGEEFSVILSETDKTNAIMAAERISSKVSQEKIGVFDEVLSVSVSIGMATFPQNTLHSDVLIEAADKALYKAKTSGRNRVCWF